MPDLTRGLMVGSLATVALTFTAFSFAWNSPELALMALGFYLCAACCWVSRD